MEIILVILSLFLIIPIYVITVNKCLIKGKDKKKLILSIFFNPTLIYILTLFLEFLLMLLFNIEINSFIELLCMIISSFVCIQGFIYIFDKERKNIGLDCFIYTSFILIEFTSISTIILGYSILESIISCIILPIISYICYYFIITKRLVLVVEEFDKLDSIIINILPCIACLIIVTIGFIGENYIDNTNSDIYHMFCCTLTFINYLILVFEFISYYIIFNNIEEKYHLNLANKQIIKSQEQLINAFCEVVENANGDTGNHVKRVSEYSKILAEALGFEPSEVENIRIASMLHDVGKIYIPNTILDKPSKLTDEEFEIIKTHVTKGEQLLHNVDGELIDLAKQIALEHHEKWNGKGYLGKKEDEISLSARIVAVADVFDALVSKRSYKDGWNVKDAYNLILSEEGKHFDPQVVRAFRHSYFEILNIYNANKET